MLNTVITHATGDVYPASDWNTYTRDNMNAYQVGRITTSPISGGPPASPGDTDIWIATGVDGLGTRWKFQYNAGSASAYKWESIGGPLAPLAGVVSSAIPGTSTWTTLLSFTAARAGEYQVYMNIYGSGNGAGISTIRIGHGFNGAFQAALAGVAPAGGADFTCGTWTSPITLTAGQILNLMGWANSQPALTAYWMKIQPERIA